MVFLQGQVIMQSEQAAVLCRLQMQRLEWKPARSLWLAGIRSTLSRSMPPGSAPYNTRYAFGLHGTMTVHRSSLCVHNLASTAVPCFECHKCSGQVREAMKSIGPTMRTTAEPRPHCYIAGDHSGLKPFGAFPPVKPVPYHGSAKAL